MDEVMNILREKGSLFTDDQNRVVADLAPLGWPREEGRYVVLMRANGSSMYLYRDIAYTLEKLARGGDLNLVVLGEDHKMYFEQLSTIIRAAGQTPPEAIHYSYILLKEGKMSTREGNVVLLEDFLNEATRRAREKVDEQWPDLPPSEKAEIAGMIGIGAVRFAILSVRSNRNVIFDWETALSFTGDSGPYIQYSCTRIASILRKGGIDPDLFNPAALAITHDAEWRLLLLLGRVSGDISQALALRNPAIVATAALDIARRFSIFYNECPVLTSPEGEIRDTRLALCVATRQTLVNLLGLLGIQAPERM
jgi:arginyl-tRNA synthetase